MRFLLLIFTTMFLFNSCGLDAEDKTLQEQYKAEWHQPNSYYMVNVGRVLVKHEVRVCASYSVRLHKKFEDEILVACTPDGENWYYYQVWLGIDKLQKVDDGSIIPPVFE